MSLELTILETLRDAGRHMMPERVLHSHVRLSSSLGEEVTLTTLREALRKLEAAREVIGVPNEDTGTRWGISDQGRARLANAGL